MRPPCKRAFIFSLTALTLPGSVVISVFCTVPATGRERAAKCVCFREAAKMRCTSPGAGRSINEEIAYTVTSVSPGIISVSHRYRFTSGVTSRTPNPVPPVVIIQSTSPDAQYSDVIRAITSFSSGTIQQWVSEILKPSVEDTIFLIVGPDKSADESPAAVSLAVNIRSHHRCHIKR